MLERVVLTLLILGGLTLLWCCWRCYRTRLVRGIEPAEAPAGVPVLLYFCADYCAPCRLQQSPIVEQLAARLGEKIVVKKYDVSAQPELASRYKVLTLPTTVVLDRQGRVAHVNHGVIDQARLEAQLS